MTLSGSTAYLQFEKPYLKSRNSSVMLNSW